jgi:hypothetical protein
MKLFEALIHRPAGVQQQAALRDQPVAPHVAKALNGGEAIG